MAEISAYAGVAGRHSCRLHGSGNTIQTLLRHGLVDEFHLWVVPVVLGSGKRLFSEGAIPAGLKLVDSTFWRARKRSLG